MQNEAILGIRAFKGGVLVGQIPHDVAVRDKADFHNQLERESYHLYRHPTPAVLLCHTVLKGKALEVLANPPEEP